ncbi:MAG: hypothetical protein QM723_11470 [Myxococcaceae bacterium]
MVRKLIASAAVVVALGLIGWAAGGQLGDPIRARKPMPAVSAPAGPGCHLLPHVEMLSPLDPRLKDLDAERWERIYLRDQLSRRTAELSDCAKLYGEPGAEQFARVIVIRTGAVHDVEVQGAFASEALTSCVESKVQSWRFLSGPVDVVLTLPVQYCPAS